MLSVYSHIHKALRRTCSQRSGRNSSGRSQLAAVRWMAVMGMCSSTCGGTTSLPPPSVTGLPVVARRKVAMPPAGYSRSVSCARQHECQGMHQHMG